jgi:hypothetical protein
MSVWRTPTIPGYKKDLELVENERFCINLRVAETISDCF